jgi:hypothetical protein
MGMDTGNKILWLVQKMEKKKKKMEVPKKKSD